VQLVHSPISNTGKTYTVKIAGNFFVLSGAAAGLRLVGLGSAGLKHVMMAMKRSRVARSVRST
jgi:hypothetical protein